MLQNIKFILILLGWSFVRLPFQGLGLFVVPFLWRYRHTNYSDLPAWTRPWANMEDWWGQRSDKPRHRNDNSLPWWMNVEGKTDFWSWYEYHAIRNATDGLRSFKWYACDASDPTKVSYKTDIYLREYQPQTLKELGRKSAYYWAWVGWKVGVDFTYLWSDTRYFNIKYGWRVEPSDKEDPRREGDLAKVLGFSQTLHRSREY